MTKNDMNSDSPHSLVTKEYQRIAFIVILNVGGKIIKKTFSKNMSIKYTTQLQIERNQMVVLEV